MQSQIAPICRAPERGLPLWGVTEAERYSVLLQDVRDLVRVPRFVARLEGHSHARREGLEGGGQANGVGTEVGRKLQQDRSDLCPKPLERLRSRRTGSVGLLRRSTWVR